MRNMKARIADLKDEVTDIKGSRDFDANGRAVLDMDEVQLVDVK